MYNELFYIMHIVIDINFKIFTKSQSPSFNKYEIKNVIKGGMSHIADQERDSTGKFAMIIPGTSIKNLRKISNPRRIIL